MHWTLSTLPARQAEKKGSTEGQVEKVRRPDKDFRMQIWLMEDLVERIVRWKIHPGELVTNRFLLEQAGEAYALMAGGKCGKVAVVFDEETSASSHK